MSTKQRRIVLLMLERGPCTIRDFMDAGISRFGARIWELQKPQHGGYRIEHSERRVAGQRHITYYLIGKGCSGTTPSLSVPTRSHARQCLECGVPLTSKKRHAKFHSTTCRTAYWKRQKNLRVIEAQQSLFDGQERLRSEREREDNFSTVSTKESTTLVQKGAA